MDLNSTWALVLEAALGGQCLLVISQLVLGGLRRPWQPALLAMFLGLLIAQISSLLMLLKVPSALSLIGLGGGFICVASLWIYVRVITSAGVPPRHWSQLLPSWLLHCWPAMLVVICVLPFAFADSSTKEAMMMTGEVDTTEKFRIAVPWVLCLFLWVVWLPCYLLAIHHRIRNYRLELRNEYSSTERRELHWISALLLVMALFWITELLDAMTYVGIQASLPTPVVFVIEAMVIWIPALWGIQQRPGMLNTATNTNVETDRNLQAAEPNRPDTPVHASTSNNKYERSALDTDRAQRISHKLEKAMRGDALYRDPMLSLDALARHLGVSKHYVSQTLNVELQESFFEYINRWRAEEAGRLLLTTDFTAVDIAHQSGFNSRSSFYTAFRKRFGRTPNAYRKESLGARG